MTNQLAFSAVFVDREAEFEMITNRLSSGDVLILGEAGIGKTAIINKVIKKISAEKITLFRINVTSGTYSGWLSQRIALMLFDKIKADEKKFSKVKKWLLKNYPDLLAFIKSVLDIEGKITDFNFSFLSSLNLPESTDKLDNSPNLDKALFCLLDEYIKETGNSVYIVIEDTHDLSLSDRAFLVELLANHSPQVHIVLSRRTQEENKSLYASPEINYLMRCGRVIYLKGLGTTAVGQLFMKSGLDLSLKKLTFISDFSRGNPYILQLMAKLTKHEPTKFDSKILDISKKYDVNNELWNYIHAQFFEKFSEFSAILKVSAILPSNIHAELIGHLLNKIEISEIQSQLSELEKRGILRKDENNCFQFFHPLFAMYLYSQLPNDDIKRLHRITCLYYQALAKKSPKPLYMIATQYHAEKSEDKELEYWVLGYFAEIFRHVGNVTESKRYCEKALKVALETKDCQKEFQSLMLQFSLAKYVQIENLDQKLIRIRYLVNALELTGNEKISALWAEANYFEGLGDPLLAIKALKKCHRFFKSFETDEYLKIIHYEASLLVDLRETVKARKLLVKCLSEFTKSGNEKGIMAVLGDLGNLEGMLVPKNSIIYFKKCIKIAEKLNDMPAIASALHGLGVANLELKEYNQALDNFNECIRITNILGDEKGLMQTYIEVARVMLAKGSVKKASSYVSKAEKIATFSNHKEGVAMVELIRGEIFEVSKNFFEARKYYLAAGEHFKKIGLIENAKYANYRVNEILPEYIGNNIEKLNQIDADGFTNAEQNLNQFIGKNVQIVINEGIWIGKLKEETRVTCQGILHRDEHIGQLTETDRLLGIGKFDWWIESYVIDDYFALSPSYILIQPYLVESIKVL